MAKSKKAKAKAPKVRKPKTPEQLKAKAPKVRKPKTPEQLKRRKRVFTFFNQLVRGAVKIWLHGTPYILPAEQVQDFIDQEIKALPEK